MAIKASNQLDLIDLTDGYSVILSNESHTFAGDTDSVSATQTITTQVMATQGEEQINCTVGTVTTPTGISVVSDGKTPWPILTITATSAVLTGGTLTIPVTIGDLTFNKVFSYAISYKGQGGTSVTVNTTETVYQASASGTEAPTGSWSATIPTVPGGQFLWTRVTVKYSDGKSTVSYSVSRQGTNGSNGSNGTSVTVKSTATTYQVSSSGTTAPTGEWLTAIPSTSPGQYLWTRVIVTYSDNKTATSYSVSRNGSNGSNGSNGADALNLVVISSGGIIFKNTAIATTLTAHVYKGGAEVTGTALTALGTIKWYKDGGTTAVATGQSLTVAAGDVTSKATYTAQLEG